MIVEELAIPGVFVLTPQRHGDLRGFFSEVYNRTALLEAGIDAEFVQDNHALSTGRGTIRGLHFQAPPMAQAKLVRVASGAALDIAVDIRKGSPTFGRYVAVELTADNWKQIFVPEGFAHGYCTLTDRVELLYKVTAPYAADCDRGFAFDDPDIGVVWPVAAVDAVLSAKDRKQPPFRDVAIPFTYAGGEPAPAVPETERVLP